MSKRILVVGGVAGGASAAARARRLDEHAEIIVFERGPHVSFSNCALPYFLSRTVADSADLVMMDPTSKCVRKTKSSPLTGKKRP